MIKKVKLIREFKEKYEKPVILFELTPPFEEDDDVIDYMIGGFYSDTSYPLCAFYKSNKEGDVLSDFPVLTEEGITSYKDIFKLINYTLI